MTIEVWQELEKKGVDDTIWKNLSDGKKNLLKSLVTKNPEFFTQLLEAIKNNKWPKDEDGNDIISLSNLYKIKNFVRISFPVWNNIKDEYRGYLLGLVGTSLLSSYIHILAILPQDKWPQYDDDSEIIDPDVLLLIGKAGFDYKEWNKINKAYREKVIGLAGQIKSSYLLEIAKVAENNKWPKDGADVEVAAPETLIQIRKDIALPYADWHGVKKEHRAFLLKFELNKKNNRALAQVAKDSTKWPKDGADTEIYNAAKLMIVVKTGIGFSAWNGTDKTYRGYLLSLAGGMSARKLKELAQVAKSPDWPKQFESTTTQTPSPQSAVGTTSQTVGTTTTTTSVTTTEKTVDVESEIQDADTLNALSKTGIAYAEWNTIKAKYRGYLLTLSKGGSLANSHLQELAKIVKGGVEKWPLDGADKNIVDAAKLTKIRNNISLKYLQWIDGIGEKNHRKVLLTTAIDDNKKVELGKVAVSGNWPKDGDGNDILGDTELKQIRNDLKVSFMAWANPASFNPDQKKAIFSMFPKKEYAHELAWRAIKGGWPKDGADAEFTSAKILEWKGVKDADISKTLTPAEWNNFPTATRALILDDTQPPPPSKYQKIVNARKAINDPEYASQAGKKTQKTLDIIGKPGFKLAEGIGGGISSALGTSSAITSASKGTQDNAGVDRASGIQGMIGDLADGATQSFSLFGSVMSIFRGKQRTKGNASRAAKKVGEKEQRPGRRGAIGSGFGIGASVSNFFGNLTKTIDPSTGGGKGTASGFGVLGGALGAISSGIGLSESLKSTYTGIRRAARTKKYIKKNPTAGTNEAKLSKIASFTAENQKIASGLIKNVNNTLSGIGSLSGIAGSFAGFFGSTGAAVTGMTADIISATTSGFGFLGGITETAVSLTEGAIEYRMDDRVNELIALLRSGYQPAVEFLRDVLKIDFGLVIGDKVTWVDWIDEDIGSAKDLIKSKMAKA
ncbi:MAG: hypothetical protein MUO76_00825 [Anaerolineaceae bacterium]|nr:hypothetical protein [Anaerolineaceae bacterium]